MTSTFDNIARWLTGKAPTGMTRNDWVLDAAAAVELDPTPVLSHQLWTNVLGRHVKPGAIRGVTCNVVDYLGANADPELWQYLDMLSKVDPAVLERNPAERLAFLLNGYNALCLGHCAQAVARRELGPMSDKQSITDLGNWVRPVWTQTVGTLAGTAVSLDMVEHKMLRAEFADPRVHACLNCASVSCPALPLAAFEPATLDQQIEACCDAWLADETKGLAITKAAGSPALTASCEGPDSRSSDGNGAKKDEAEPQLKMSKIFHWYESDFAVATSLSAERLGAGEAAAAAEQEAADTGMSPTLRFASNYSSELRRQLRSGNGGWFQRPSYFDYDWGLIIDAARTPTTSKRDVVVEFESPW